MTISKSWEWEKETSEIWLRPSKESYYPVNRWKTAGFGEILDLGCGLGLHSIFFARNGFKVSSCDLSVEGVDHLKKWAGRENLNIDARVADMLRLPYAADSFDCVFAYHVISHTDSKRIRKIISVIKAIAPGIFRRNKCFRPGMPPFSILISTMPPKLPAAPAFLPASRSFYPCGSP